MNEVRCLNGKIFYRLSLYYPHYKNKKKQRIFGSIFRSSLINWEIFELIKFNRYDLEDIFRRRNKWFM